MVADPLSLAALSAVALSQGISFLYSQLGDLLRRRRERRAAAGNDLPEADVVAPLGSAAQVLDGALAGGPIDLDALDRHADQLAALRGLLLPYVEGDKPVEPSNRQLLEQVDAARALLEQVYGQHISFVGERRPATGTALAGQAGDIGQYARQVIASGERAVAVGGDMRGSTIITGDQSGGGATAGAAG